MKTNAPFASMHVRRTDKSKEAKFISVSEYLENIRDYFDIKNAEGIDLENKKVKAKSHF